MSKRTISTNQLTVGTQFYVDGVVNFSRIASKVEGEELRQDQERRRAKGWIPVEIPYTTMTVSNAVVRCIDPNNKTPEEIYATESLYTSNRNPNAGWFFSGQNRGRNLPWVGVREGNGPDVVQVIPEGELANGLHVTLVMRVFKGKPNNGISLEGIIVNEPIRYYNFNQAGAGLDAIGLNFHPVANAPAQGAQDGEDTNPYDEVYDSGIDNAGYDHFSSQPAAQPIPQTMPQTTPQASAPMHQGNVAGSGNMPFGQNGNGIVYNPQGGNRNY